MARPRIRSIKPEYFGSLAIGRLSIPARLLFISLWTFADDEGRGSADSRQVKAHAFPLDDDVTAAVVAELLDELAQAGRIIRYRTGDRELYQVVNWAEHQKINRGRPSTYPPPPGHTPQPTTFTDAAVSDHGTVSEESVSDHEPVTDTSRPDLDHGSGSGSGSWIGSDLDPSVPPAVTQGATGLRSLIPDGQSAGWPPVIEEAAELYAAAQLGRARAKSPTSRANFLDTCRQNALLDHGELLTRYLTDHPTATADDLVGVILTGAHR